MSLYNSAIAISGDPREPKTFAMALHPLVQDIVYSIALDSRHDIKAIVDAMAEALERMAKALRLSCVYNPTREPLTEAEAAAVARQVFEILTGDPQYVPPTIIKQIVNVDGRRVSVSSNVKRPEPPPGCVAEGDERIGCAHRGYCWRPQPCQPPEHRNGPEGPQRS